MTMDNRNRWLALIVLCLGTLMIVLDTTIVNVALPSIRADLHFSQTSLAWVVNAYLLTFGLRKAAKHSFCILQVCLRSRSDRSPATCPGAGTSSAACSRAGGCRRPCTPVGRRA